MKRFNYEEHLDKTKKNYRLSLLILILSIVLFVGVFVIGILVSNYHNRFIIMVIFSIIIGVLTLLTTINLFTFVLPYKKEIKQVYFILGGYLTTVRGVISENKGYMTSVNGRRCIELIVKDEEKETSVFLDPLFGENVFSIGDEVSLKTSESFIIKYEVHHD